MNQPRIGSTWQDHSGLRWTVKRRRPETPEQYVVEADLGGDYPRSALYVMTANEIERHVARASTKVDTRDRPSA